MGFFSRLFGGDKPQPPEQPNRQEEDWLAADSRKGAEVRAAATAEQERLTKERGEDFRDRVAEKALEQAEAEQAAMKEADLQDSQERAREEAA